MEYEKVIEKLEALNNPRNVEGMARFGIRPKTRVLGIPIPELRKMAKVLRQAQDKQKNHELASKLWDSGIHEARILAGYIADPAKITEKQFGKWVKDFDSWDVVDQVCSSVVKNLPTGRQASFAVEKIFELANREEEFVKRTAFTLICCLTVHDKKMPDKDFIKFFPIIKKAAIDERNFVKKAVNWALRQIGKRNKKLNIEAIKLAKEIRQLAEKINSKSAKWVANNAITELTSDNVRKRLKK